VSTEEQHWHRLRRAFTAVLEAPSEERESLLAEHCGGDDALRAEVEELLAAHSEDPEYLEVAAWPGDVAAVPAHAPGEGESEGSEAPPLPAPPLRSPPLPPLA